MQSNSGLLPVHPCLLPDGLQPQDNGRLDPQLLETVAPGCMLFWRAARAWKALAAAARKAGFALALDEKNAGYRSLDVQQALFLDRHMASDRVTINAISWNRSLWRRRPGAAPAAVPGACFHGLGLGVALSGVTPDTPLYDWLCSHAPRYGWCWMTPRRPGQLVYGGVAVEDGVAGAGVARTVHASGRYEVMADTAGAPCASDAPVAMPGGPDLGTAVMPICPPVSAWESQIRAMRNAFAGTVFTVSGSVGKTTTARFLARALQWQGSCLAGLNGRSPGDVTNAVMQLSDQPFAVFEIGQGLLPQCARALSADVAILMSLSPARVQPQQGLEDMARRQAEIFQGGMAGSVAVINRDIPCFAQVEQIAQAHGRQALTYGVSEKADFRLLSYSSQDGSFCFHFRGKLFQARLAVPDTHTALDALAVIAAMHGARLNWPCLLRYFQRITRVPARHADLHDIPVRGGQCRILEYADDTHPETVAVALADLSGQSVSGMGRRIAVLSGLPALDGGEPGRHAHLSEALVASDVQLLVLVGEQSRLLKQDLPKGFPCIEFSSVDLLFSTLPDLLRGGDAILFNGAGDCGLHAGLQTFLGRRPAGETRQGCLAA